MDINELVLLKDGVGINRMKSIRLINENVHLYVMHTVYIEEPILSLESNVGPNEKDEECAVRDKDSLEDLNSLEDGNLDDLNNGVKFTFDDLDTFEDLSNLSDKFDEGGTTSVEDIYAIDQESSDEDVNLEGTTKGIEKKDSCKDVTLEGTTECEDAIMNITLEGATDYMVCDQEVDVLDDTLYLVHVQKDLLVEGLICNQE